MTLSEICLGKVLTGQYSPNIVNPNTLAVPYGDILAAVRKGLDQSELVSKFGFTPINAPIQAAELVKNDKKGIEWVKLLERSALMADAGKRLTKVMKQMERGEEVDVGRVLAILASMNDDRMDFETLDKVTPEPAIWQPTFYGPIDQHVGGFVKGGLVIIGAPPGTGKTTLLLRLLLNAAAKKKKVAFFSLEMTLAQIAMRLIEVEKRASAVTKAHIIASEDVCGVDELYAKASQLAAQNPGLYMIGIDFADYLVDDEQSEQVMAHIYKVLAILAKRLGITVVLIAQLSRRYEGGMPRVSHIRYSGMAEAMASLILLLWNPDQLWVDQGQSKATNPLPYVPDTAYVIVGKSRYGFKEGGVGAFRAHWDGGMGWGAKSEGWYPLTGA